MEWNSGNLSITNDSLQAIPQTATWLRIDAIDCVGHISSSNFSIQRVNQISSALISVGAIDSGSVIITSSGIIHDGDFSILLTSLHPVEISFSCYSSSSYYCLNSTTSNFFEVIVSSNSISEQVSFSFSDSLGNEVNQTINISADTTNAICEVEEYATLNISTLTLPSSSSSIFSCTDNLAGIRSIIWQDSNGTISWIPSQNNLWNVPPPISDPTSLIITDNVGNVFSKSYNIVFDDQAPVLSITPIANSISFDEGVSRSDASFTLSCNDIYSQTCLIDVLISDASSGQNMSFDRINNIGDISIPSPALNSTIRIEINVVDEIGNRYYLSRQFQIDDDSPLIEIGIYSQITGDVLPQGVISYDGIISLDNLATLDVNYSLSTGFILNCTTSTITYSGALQSDYDLKNFDLSNCGQFTFGLFASDHVGNKFETSLVLSVDYFQPKVTYFVNQSCSWDAGNYLDVQSNCIVNVIVNDDQSSNLSSTFILTLMIDGQVVRTHYLQESIDIDLSDYPDKSISMSVSGFDKVGNQVETNNLNVVTLDEITPIWTGIICAGNAVCNWSGQIIASSHNETIGVKTPYLQAPIIEFKMIFENAIDEYQFAENNFTSSNLPDGSYMMTPIFKDAAGREYRSVGVSFVYDNQAPIIEVLEAQSNGIVNESLILSCDHCELVWRVNEITTYTSTTNHGIFSSEDGQYRLPTTTLGQNMIVISAVDAFGRESKLTYYSTPVRTTIINPVEDLLSNVDINLQCVEAASIDDIRQVTCLWKRKESTVDKIPIQINVDIDQKELRDVELLIYKSGGGVEVLDLNSGTITIPNINHYVNSFELHLSDSYSEVNAIKFELIEHSSAWSDIYFADSDLSAESFYSNFEVIISPPINEKEYHLIRRGLITIDDLFNCDSLYSFSQHSEVPITIVTENCQIDTESMRLLTNGSISFSINVNHTNVRNSSANYLVNHSAPLFNIEYYSLGITYRDDLGISSSTTKGQLVINNSNIIRAEDNSPTFNESFVNICPLGTDNLHWAQSDGFLQSQETSPLSECSGAMNDLDGINRIIWRFIFSEGNSKYESEIECHSTYFPREWNFQNAIDANICKEPSNKFPSGVYDVAVRPWVVDESIYVRDIGEYRITENGYYAKPITTTDCEESTECQFVEYILYDVVVSSSLDPIAEVENSKELVNSAKSFIESPISLMMILISITSLLGLIYSVFIKVKRFRDAVSNMGVNEHESEADHILTIAQVRDIYARPGLAKVISDYDIADEDGFLLFAAQECDFDLDTYLSTAELTFAAEKWEEKNLSEMANSQLKSKLKEMNLPTGGIKKELVSRIINSRYKR